MNIYYAIPALLVVALLLAIILLKIIFYEYLECEYLKIDIDFSKPKPKTPKITNLTPKDDSPVTNKFETIDL